MSNDCPSCGRYVGAHEACPYCGARLTGRAAIQTVKIAAIALATVGLVALWFAAINAETPLITIGQAGATMNMAYVRLAGRCTRAPSYDPESDYLSFWLEDDTGEIYVMAYRAEARAIIEQGRAPALGDQVEVAGTLRVREDFLSLTVNVPEQVQVSRSEPTAREIGDITPEDRYRRVRVRGVVREIYTPYDGLTLITLRDASGAIPVAVSQALIDLSDVPLPASVAAGQAVEVVGAVSLYGDTPQIVPASVADVVPLNQDQLDQPVPLAIEKPIDKLTVEDVGQSVVVRGQVVRLTPFSAGQKLILDDGTGRITVLLWDAVYAALPDPDNLAPGAEIQALGTLAQYRGKLELIPELAQDVQTLAPPAGPAQASIADLTAQDVGRLVALRGRLGAANRFSAGVKFPLADEGATITLLLWQNVYEEAPPGLGANAVVAVAGHVAEYRGELEIVPRSGDDIDVQVASAPSEIVETTPIGDVTVEAAGETRTLTGVLGPRETFSAGVKFPLTDESGTITLLLWQEVYEATPDRERLNAGVRVEAAGRIEVYQGELQIIPQADGIRVLE